MWRSGARRPQQHQPAHAVQRDIAAAVLSEVPALRGNVIFDLHTGGRARWSGRFLIG